MLSVARSKIVEKFIKRRYQLHKDPVIHGIRVKLAESRVTTVVNLKGMSVYHHIEGRFESQGKPDVRLYIGVTQKYGQKFSDVLESERYTIRVHTDQGISRRLSNNA